jgi:hypothetical protein
MRAFVQCSLAFVGFAAILSRSALAETFAQPAEDTLASPAEDVEEIIVRGGKTLSEWRLVLEQAQDDLLELFNELNEGQDNDVRCRNEVPTGSRIPQRVCRSHAEERGEANGARQFLSALLFGSGRSSATGEQVNSEIGMGHALGDAVRDGARAEDQFQAEWGRVLGANHELYEAAVEYAELKQESDRLSGTTSALAQQPRQILLGRAGPQCEASTYTEYQQLNTVAHVSGTVGISACPAGTTGSFTLVAHVRDEAGAITPIEFSETWQRADAQDHVFSSDYPIGENVALVSVRVRHLTCTCEASTQ